jgi:hypothetical protein
MNKLMKKTLPVPAVTRNLFGIVGPRTTTVVKYADGTYQCYVIDPKKVTVSEYGAPAYGFRIKPEAPKKEAAPHE